MDNKQVLYYKVEYSTQHTLDYDELAHTVIKDNPEIEDDTLITIWQDNMDRYFQLVDFWDGEYLSQHQLDMVDDAVSERLEVFIMSNANNG